VRQAWDDGSALKVLLAWVAAQGGRVDPARDDFGLDCAPAAADLTAPHDGWLASVDCRQVGLALADLGAARRKVEDALDLSAGVDWLTRVGRPVKKGEPLARVFTRDAARAAVAVDRLGSALVIGREPVAELPLILGRVE
jgi:pyrimidine-nucleoside phosphorylase